MQHVDLGVLRDAWLTASVTRSSNAPSRRCFRFSSATATRNSSGSKRERMSTYAPGRVRTTTRRHLAIRPVRDRGEVPLGPHPLHERNPVQQLETDFTGPRTDEQRARRAAIRSISSNSCRCVFCCPATPRSASRTREGPWLSAVPSTVCASSDMRASNVAALSRSASPELANGAARPRRDAPLSGVR